MWRRLLTVFIVMLFAPHVAHAVCISPAGEAGQITYNADSGVPQYCDDTNWIAMSGIEQSGPSDCPNPGDVCNDSTIFAGISPDGNLQMFTTAADLGTARWSNGNDVTGYTSNTDGDGNTAGLATYAGAGTPYTAALDCYNSTADGYSDWYLPARDELSVLYDNRIAIGGFTLTADYWSSSENSSNNAREVGFNDGITGNLNKGTTINVRCVRKRSTEMTEVVPSGLVGHWRLDETSGATVADSSGNGYDATLATGDMSTKTVSGMVGTGADLRADQGPTASAPAAFNSMTQFTFTAWAKLDDASSNNNFFELENLFRVKNNWGLNQIELRATGWDTTAGQFLSGGGTGYNIGEWTHIAISYDYTQPIGTRPKMYINGTEISVSTGVGAAGSYVAPSGNGFIIGDSISVGANGVFKGSVDDVRLYNRILSAAEVAEIYDARDGIRYNETAHTPEYFDGNKWAAMIPPWPEPYSGPSTYPATQYSSSLVGYWKLDEITYTSAADSSGNGHDGSLLNGLDPTSDSVTGAIRTALTFDGVDDTILIAANSAFDIVPSSSFSQFIWFRKTTDCGANAGANNEVMMNRFGVGYTDRTWWFGCRASTDNLEINFYGSSGSVSVTGPAIDDGQWHHGGWVYDGSVGEVRLYLDGVEYNSASYTLVGNMDANPICIGGYDANCSDSRFFFDGELDDARIFNRALSTTEIQNVYNQTSALYQGLVGHWKLDETSGTTAVDSSGNGNDGTMQNGMDAADDSSFGAVATAIDFDGVDDYINLGSGPDINEDLHTFSYSMWIYPTGWGDGDQGNIFTMNNGNSGPGRQLRVHNLGPPVQSLRAYMAGTGGAASVYTAPNTINLNEWQHIVVTYDDVTERTIHIYKNGVELAYDTNTPANGSYFSGTDNVTWIGEENDTSPGDEHFQGHIDDFRIYDRILTPAEIAKLYNMGAPIGQSTALPRGCPNVGDACDDGTIYVGDSPDGVVEMFMTDLSYEGSEISWGAVPQANNPLTNINDTNDGDGNTDALVVTDSDTVTGGFQTHPAAQYCYDLVAHGADDWYLPAENELGLIYNGGSPLGDIRTGLLYWTSTERSGVNTQARSRNFDNGFFSNTAKSGTNEVRCVRKGPAPRCANPYGLEGAMLYNADHTVVQYCDGARWISIGKRQ